MSFLITRPNHEPTTKYLSAWSKKIIKLANAIGGQDDKILVETGNNEHLLHSRITYAVSCSCGKKLGPKSVEKGNGTFIGYDDDFVFTSDRRYISKPLEDKRAQPFMEASNHVAISLLKGHQAHDSSKRSKAMFEKSYQNLLSSNIEAKI